MKRKISIIFLILSFVMVLSSCQMEAVVPEDQVTISVFSENKSLYLDCISYITSQGYDSLISRTDFWAPEGSEGLDGFYIQNMEDNSFKACKEPCISALFENSDVKMIDFIERDGLSLCTFSMCLASRNFDYGFYYVNEDKPVFFGDLSAELMENGKGFSYEKKASYGVKFTYYTEKIEDNIYYFEIT